jgi:putative colanic acid biosynthesis glycosyltransferase
MKLSIITVTFNNLDGLKRTQLGVARLLESRKDIEWIVVDGASEDATPVFLQTLAGAAVRSVSERDAGIYDAMNKGVRLAVGKYVIFLNAGDCLIGDRLGQVLDQMDPFDVGFCGVIYQYPAFTRERPAKEIHYARYGMPANHQGCIYRRARILKLPYPEKYRISGDYWLNASVLMLGWQTHAFPECIVAFEVGGTSTVNYRRVVKEMAAIQREVLALPNAVVWFFSIRRFFVMTVNSFLFRCSAFSQRLTKSSCR